MTAVDRARSAPHTTPIAILPAPNSSAVPAHSDQGHVTTRRGLLGEFWRYVMVGGCAFVLDWAVLRLGIAVGVHYLAATALGFIAGLAFNYGLCVAWVWRGTRATGLRDLVRFTLIGIGGLLLTEGMMRLAVGSGGLAAPVAKPPIAAFVLLWNFGLRRYFVFFH